MNEENIGNCSVISTCLVMGGSTFQVQKFHKSRNNKWNGYGVGKGSYETNEAALMY